MINTNQQQNYSYPKAQVDNKAIVQKKNPNVIEFGNDSDIEMRKAGDSPRNDNRYPANINNVKNNMYQLQQQSQGLKRPNLIKPQGKPGEWGGARNEDELQKLCNDHEKLISLILEEEEDLISSHRKHIDDMVELVKQEMLLLHEVDKPGSDVEEYVTSLDAILAHKMEVISVLRGRLLGFHEHLKQEEGLSKRFYDQQTEVMDVFNLQNEEGLNGEKDDVQLLEDLNDVMI